MNSTFRNIISVFVGLLIGGTVNMAIIYMGPSIIPYPEGVDPTTTEGLQASMPLFGPEHFIMPFLAHALGTFVGALIAGGIAIHHRFKIALAIGIVNLIGGFSMVLMVPSPIWFSVIDLVVAYMPMAYWAGKIIDNKSGGGNSFGPVL
jgi:hypothetical protein